MWKNYIRKLKNSALIILGSLILLVFIIGVYYITQNSSPYDDATKIFNVTNESIINKTPEELCETIEFELNDKEIGDIAQPWRCSIVNETTSAQDIVFNVTKGLCRCSTILNNGREINVEVRLVE